MKKTNIVEFLKTGGINSMATNTKLNPGRNYMENTTKNKNNNHTILIVDASGSMIPYEDETRKSIYSIIKELNKDTHFTLIFFDTNEYKIVVDDWTSKIAPELGYTYKGNGGTPITDSIYKAIQDITNSVSYLEQLSENHKFVVFTDGQENSSKYVKSEDLGRAIEHFTDNFGWNFQFIGPKSEEKGITEYANSIKIKKENLTLYADMSEGLKEMREKVISK